MEVKQSTCWLQDTAGQERFSSLSSAFFRGADAVVLMFDVNQPQTLEALRKWWEEFRDRAPVPEDQVDRFCCVFVGNKIDVSIPNDAPIAGPLQSGSISRIGEEKARRFMEELIPRSPVTPNLPGQPLPQRALTTDQTTMSFSIVTPSPPRTHSIDIGVYHHVRRKSPRSRSRSTMFRGTTVGTMTTHTLSVYHTPSSSIFDSFESARSSPVHFSRASTPSRSRSPSYSPERVVRRQPSYSSTLSDARTITPSLFGRSNGDTRSTTPAPAATHALSMPPSLETGAKLFFASAKTGEGVSNVFEYVAERVVRRWEYEEAMENRTLHMADASVDGTIRLQHPNDSQIWTSTSCCKT